MNTNRKRYIAADIADALDARVVPTNSPNGKGSHALHIHFDNVSSLIALRDACKPVAGDKGWNRSWTLDFRMAMAEGQGCPTLAGIIESRAKSMSAGATLASSWTMAPAGAYPIVPVALGGDPFSMRCRTEQASQTAPVRVYLPLNCSSAIHTDEFAGVLADILAAITAMAEVRPVELIGYCSLEADATMTDRFGYTGQVGANFYTVPIEYRFADYTGLAVWCDVSVGRTIAMSIARDLGTGYDGHWPWSTSPSKLAGDFGDYRLAMGLSDEDVLIPPLYGKDGIELARKLMRETAAANGITIEL